MVVTECHFNLYKKIEHINGTSSISHTNVKAYATLIPMNFTKKGVTLLPNKHLYKDYTSMKPAAEIKFLTASKQKK